MCLVAGLGIINQFDAGAVALQVHRVLGLRDLSRIDMILDSSGAAQVLDINIAPGMTETSLFPQAAEAGGLELGELYREICASALTR